MRATRNYVLMPSKSNVVRFLVGLQNVLLILSGELIASPPLLLQAVQDRSQLKSLMNLLCGPWGNSSFIFWMLAVALKPLSMFSCKSLSCCFYFIFFFGMRKKQFFFGMRKISGLG